MAIHRNGRIGCKAHLEPISDGSYLVNIRAENGDHIELVANGVNHACERLRSFASDAGYNILYAEGVPAHWREKVAAI